LAPAIIIIAGQIRWYNDEFVVREENKTTEIATNLAVIECGW